MGKRRKSGLKALIMERERRQRGVRKFFTDELGRRRPLTEKLVGRPPRRPTTVIYGVAEMDGETYVVYGRRGGREERVIFPKSEAFKNAPFGAVFTVNYRGKSYKARKKARIIPGRGPVPVLEWELS